MITNHTLVNVPKGSAYSNFSGEGTICVKVRAVTRNENGTISSKRGVAFGTDRIQDIPAFVLNVYKNWDGRGELQYAVVGPHEIVRPTTQDLSKLILDSWTTIAGAETE